MRAWLLAVAVAVPACALGVPTPTPPRTLAAPTAAVVLSTPTTAPRPTIASPPASTATGAPANQAPTPITASIATLGPTRAPPTATADPNRGVVFGKPVALIRNGTRRAAVLVTNTSSLVKTLVVKATYKQADRIVAVAESSVTDLLPGQTRAALLVGRDQIPASAESVRVDADMILDEAPSTARSTAAGLVRFGPLRVNATTVDVEATNGGDALHAIVVQAIFLRGADLIGVATGSVSDLAAGQTKTATLILEGETRGHDRTLVAVDTVLQ